MKKMKIFGLVVVTAVSLMALATSASATILTSPEGSQIPSGSTFQAVNTGTVSLTPPFGAIECKSLTLKGSISNAGSSTTTVGATVSTLTFGECNATVTVLKTGSLEIHTFEGSADGNGTVTGSGQEITVEFIGTHCIFATNNTDLGKYDKPTASEPQHNLLTLTGKLPRIGGRSGAFCGSEAVLHLTATVLQLTVAGVTVTYVSID